MVDPFREKVSRDESKSSVAKELSRQVGERQAQCLNEQGTMMLLLLGGMRDQLTFWVYLYSLPPLYKAI